MGRCEEGADGADARIVEPGPVRRGPTGVRSSPLPDAAQLAPRLLAALAHPGGRPLALRGRSGSGKTALLRGLTSRTAPEAAWCSAFELAHGLADAIREGRYESYRSGLSGERRPLCVEHLEDLRGRPRTREELRRILDLAARRRTVLLTLTRARGDAEVLRWLRPWAEILSLD